MLEKLIHLIPVYVENAALDQVGGDTFKDADWHSKLKSQNPIFRAWTPLFVLTSRIFVLFLFSLPSFRVSLTQINISKIQSKGLQAVFRFCHASCPPTQGYHPFLKFWFVTLLGRIKDLCLFSIFFFDFKSMFDFFFLFTCLHPSPWTLTYSVHYLFFFFFDLKRKGGCFCQQCKSNFLVTLLRSISAWHTGHTTSMRRATSVNRNEIGNL